MDRLHLLHRDPDRAVADDPVGREVAGEKAAVVCRQVLRLDLVSAGLRSVDTASKLIDQGAIRKNPEAVEVQVIGGVMIPDSTNDRDILRVLARTGARRSLFSMGPA
jgi:hypothetical protein